VTPGVAARREFVVIAAMLLSSLRRMGSKSALKSAGRPMKKRIGTLWLGTIENVAGAGVSGTNEERICLMEILFI